MAIHNPKPAVSARWLFTAVCVSLLAAAFFAWTTLCLLFWQGSWQLLYHPVSAVARTPASIGLPYDPVGFASTEAGEPRLKGWRVPAASDGRYGRYTVLLLHGKDGNLGDTLDALAALHKVGVNVLAFDYRGYGQSQFQHPSEARWREDAEWALQYLTGTRQVAANTILLDGEDLGANLALEIAAQHPELGGVVLESPLESPLDAIFNDPRARLVPARLLVGDHFDANAPASALRIPSLWLFQLSSRERAAPPEKPQAFQKVRSSKMLVWLASSPDAGNEKANSLARWLDDLGSTQKCNFIDAVLRNPTFRRKAAKRKAKTLENGPPC